MKKVNLVSVAGVIGSGKTYFLNEQVQTNSKRPSFMVQELLGTISENKLLEKLYHKPSAKHTMRFQRYLLKKKTKYILFYLKQIAKSEGVFFDLFVDSAFLQDNCYHLFLYEKHNISTRQKQQLRRLLIRCVKQITNFAFQKDLLVEEVVCCLNTDIKEVVNRIKKRNRSVKDSEVDFAKRQYDYWKKVATDIFYEFRINVLLPIQRRKRWSSNLLQYDVIVEEVKTDEQD